MEIDNKIKMVVAALVIAVLSALGGRYAAPTKVVTKTEEKIVIKEVVKTEYKSSQVINRDQEQVIDETILPDGTIKRRIRIVNKDQITNNNSGSTVAESSSETYKKTETTSTRSKMDWNVSALATKSHTDSDMLSGSVSYGLHVQRRIIGTVNVGAFGLTNKTYGVSVGVSF